MAGERDEGGLGGSQARESVPSGAANHSSDTIAAIATAVAAGSGSVAIVRLSGPEAERIGQCLFQAPGTQVWDSHRVLYGHVIDPASGERVDEALLLLMRAPRSFTREDVVELHCHGGLEAVRRVLELVLAAGARRARPGEFSQRAFLNGRLDLTRAEALAALIDARGRRAAQLAMAGLDGGVQRRISALRERLLDQLAELEARVDFEEDLPPLDGEAVVAELAAVQAELERLVAEGQQGELLRQGLRVAIVGRPNVGKSSLLNLLSRRERAIVTDLPGTTRDLLESDLVLDGVPLTLIDTAGIRPTDDPVERLGIARSHQALAVADVVLLLFDLAAGWTPEDAQLRDLVPAGVPLLLVGNKADLLGETGLDDRPGNALPAAAAQSAAAAQVMQGPAGLEPAAVESVVMDAAARTSAGMKSVAAQSEAAASVVVEPLVAERAGRPAHGSSVRTTGQQESSPLLAGTDPAHPPVAASAAMESEAIKALATQSVAAQSELAASVVAERAGQPAHGSSVRTTGVQESSPLLVEAGPAHPPVAAVRISALRGDGRERLAQALLRLCGAGDLEGLQVALNARQRDLAAHAATALAASQAAASEQLPWDFWTIDLREAVRRLGEITGEEVSEAVLDRVFARFCIGK